ncbi:DUF6737 family protein [Prochlorococcus sp. MIT 1300]|uniref:DUF6737 family protein n=1 Tax=Prochlorococcus sp. MIT 1300 TaxID=3096218 RepID=UPI002A750703|nr:DUF6737 family protein [Prochlorococcus sp. MIT 1300]
MEKNSIWSQKPWWCQPWSILLTGILVITFSWLFFNSLIITTFVLAGVVLWWWLFLIFAPNAYEAD